MDNTRAIEILEASNNSLWERLEDLKRFGPVITEEYLETYGYTYQQALDEYEAGKNSD